MNQDDGPPSLLSGSAPEVESPVLPTTVDLEPGRDRVRAALAFGLLGILAAEVLIALLSTMRANPDMKAMMELVFAPTVALVGSALGFYYGTKVGVPTK